MEVVCMKKLFWGESDSQQSPAKMNEIPSDKIKTTEIKILIKSARIKTNYNY